MKSNVDFAFHALYTSPIKAFSWPSSCLLRNTFASFEPRTIENAQLVRLWYEAGRKKAGPGNAVAGCLKQGIKPDPGATAIDKALFKLYIVFMARLTGDFKFTGTIDGLCFYKMYGGYFVRTKTSLTGKRFWKDKAFEGSRRSCSLLAKASALSSLFYKTYPKEKRRKGLFNEMTGRVKLWLKEGKTEEETMLLLQESYPVKQKEIKEENKPARKEKYITAKKKEKLFIVSINRDFIPKQQRHTKKRLYCLKE